MGAVCDISSSSSHGTVPARLSLMCNAQEMLVPQACSSPKHLPAISRISEGGLLVRGGGSNSPVLATVGVWLSKVQPPSLSPGDILSGTVA